MFDVLRILDEFLIRIHKDDLNDLSVFLTAFARLVSIAMF